MKSTEDYQIIRKSIMESFYVLSYNDAYPYTTLLRLAEAKPKAEGGRAWGPIVKVLPAFHSSWVFIPKTVELRHSRFVPVQFALLLWDLFRWINPDSCDSVLVFCLGWVHSKDEWVTSPVSLYLFLSSLKLRQQISWLKARKLLLEWS